MDRRRAMKLDHSRPDSSSRLIPSQLVKQIAKLHGVTEEALRRRWLRCEGEPTRRHGNLKGTAAEEAAIIAYAIVRTKKGRLVTRKDIMYVATRVLQAPSQLVPSLRGAEQEDHLEE